MTRTKFEKWIYENGGPAKVAAKLNVTTRCVSYWVEKKSSPRIDKMFEIVKLSKGKLTHTDLVNARRGG